MPDTQIYATHVVCSCWGIVFALGKEDIGFCIEPHPYPTSPTIPVPMDPRTCGDMKYHHSLIHKSVSCVTEVAISCCWLLSSEHFWQHVLICFGPFVRVIDGVAKIEGKGYDHLIALSPIFQRFLYATLMHLALYILWAWVCYTHTAYTGCSGP